MIDDQELLLETFAAADELSRLADRVIELALRVDRLVGLIAERFAPAALDRLELNDRCELAAGGGTR